MKPKINSSLFGPVWNTQMAKEIDEKTIAIGKISSEKLMENAGKSVFHEIIKRFDKNIQFLIICGSGNNGGDGYVICKYLLADGYKVKCYYPDEPKTKDSRNNFQFLKTKYPNSLVHYKKDALSSFLADSRIPIVLIDALFGIGLNGNIEKEPIKDLLFEVNNKKIIAKVSIDIPSGINGDCETINKNAIKADLTITFGQIKPVHIVAPYNSYCGEIVVKKIGFDEKQSLAIENKQKIYRTQIRKDRWLAKSSYQRLSKNSNKYDRGHVLIIGGESGLTGAALLSAMASYKTGAGWVSVALPSFHESSQIVDTFPEIVAVDLWGNKSELDISKLKAFVSAKKVKSIVMGPGLRKNCLNQEIINWISSTIDSKQLYVHLDAGCLEGLFSRLENLPNFQNKVSASPHPGEWQKMGLEKYNPALVSHHKKILETIARTGTGVIYKLATPMVFSAFGDENSVIYQRGSCLSLAKAGTGDVLSGIIGALGALGLDAREALIRGYLILKNSAKYVSEVSGENSVTPINIIENLGRFS